MIRKIINPFEAEINRCFGCGPFNPSGLKLEFMEDDDKLITKWKPSEIYQGYPNMLHGGIIATLFDETAAWTVYTKGNTAGVTSSMNIKFHHPVHINKGAVTVSSHIEEMSSNSAIIKCSLFDNDNRLCAEAELDYFIYPQEIAVRKFKYPGREAFYGKENS
ncbi:MAG: PaaI family thioesterase [Bacteroidales bacterium]|nr:PaaI family thioesterase [Bacteroidales bacterium]